VVGGGRDGVWSRAPGWEKFWYSERSIVAVFCFARSEASFPEIPIWSLLHTIIWPMSSAKDARWKLIPGMLRTCCVVHWSHENLSAPTGVNAVSKHLQWRRQALYRCSAPNRSVLRTAPKHVPRALELTKESLGFSLRGVLSSEFTVPLRTWTWTRGSSCIQHQSRPPDQGVRNVYWARMSKVQTKKCNTAIASRSDSL
jgi:hypothetical protein